LAVARHLPPGRHRAGDRHLNFYDSRDNLATLRRLGLRRIQMSKYCVAVALLFPVVRPNPWHRTLRHYLADPCTEHEDASIPTFYSSR
jgi:hypothetical protein